MPPADPPDPLPPEGTPTPQFASRGGLKLDFALRRFAQTHGLSLDGAVCADLGCSTGGFTDCLLCHGARRVYSVDTAYGELAWKLRNDPRVVVMERTNALHTAPPEDAAGRADLVVIDLGWTRQARALPAAMPWLAPQGRVVTLVKPHYESGRHRLNDDEARAVLDEVLAAMPALGVAVIDCVQAPIRGGKGRNLEALALLRRA